MDILRYFAARGGLWCVLYWMMLVYCNNIQRIPLIIALSLVCTVFYIITIFLEWRVSNETTTKDVLEEIDEVKKEIEDLIEKNQ